MLGEQRVFPRPAVEIGHLRVADNQAELAVLKYDDDNVGEIGNERARGGESERGCGRKGERWGSRGERHRRGRGGGRRGRDRSKSTLDGRAAGGQENSCQE